MIGLRRFSTIVLFFWLLVSPFDWASAQVEISAGVAKENNFASASPHPDGYWIVVWQNNAPDYNGRPTVYSRKVNSGQLGPALDISKRGMGDNPSIVYNDRTDEFMAAWNTPTTDVRSRIEVQPLDNDGFEKSGFKAISSRVRFDAQPQIAYGSLLNNYLVGWTRYPVSSSEGKETWSSLYVRGKKPSPKSLFNIVAFYDNTLGSVVYNPIHQRFVVGLRLNRGDSDYLLYAVPVDPNTGAFGLVDWFYKKTDSVSPPKLAVRPTDGSMMAVWLDSRGVVIQSLTSESKPSANSRVLAATGYSPCIATCSNGYVVGFSKYKGGWYEAWIYRLDWTGKVVSKKQVVKTRGPGGSNFVSFNPANGLVLAGYTQWDLLSSGSYDFGRVFAKSYDFN